jgi:hypothetical protein
MWRHAGAPGGAHLRQDLQRRFRRPQEGAAPRSHVDAARDHLVHANLDAQLEQKARVSLKTRLGTGGDICAWRTWLAVSVSPLQAARELSRRRQRAISRDPAAGGSRIFAAAANRGGAVARGSATARLRCGRVPARTPLGAEALAEAAKPADAHAARRARRARGLAAEARSGAAWAAPTARGACACALRAAVRCCTRRRGASAPQDARALSALMAAAAGPTGSGGVVAE